MQTCLNDLVYSARRAEMRAPCMHNAHDSELSSRELSHQSSLYELRELV